MKDLQRPIEHQSYQEVSNNLWEVGVDRRTPREGKFPV